MIGEQGDWVEVSTQPDVEDVLHVEVGGYEGPLDLLLDLARRQKVDLASISILALAEQYLKFIETIREKRIEIAADYLVMAAWLAYLKSRLMVPQAANDDEPSGEMLAAMLQFRLKRLEAMRLAASRLMGRAQLGREIHARGAPEAVQIARRSIWEASYYELLKAYASQRERNSVVEYRLATRTVWSLQEARDILQRLIGDTGEWVALEQCLAEYLVQPEERRTVRASSFASTLELVRQGEIEIRQSGTFEPIFLRRKIKE